MPQEAKDIQKFRIVKTNAMTIKGKATIRQPHTI